MRILLINHYAGSPRHGMEFRPYYLAREWVRQGHVVQIVGASHSHVRQLNPDVGWMPRNETIDGVAYTWLPTPRYKKNGLLRALNVYAFALQLWLIAGRLARRFRPDVVIASSTHPFDIYGAAKVARVAGARLVFELHDIWPASLIEVGGMSHAHPFVLHTGIAERAAYSRADVVVSILPDACEHAKSRGMKGTFVHIPNGFVREEWDRTHAQLPTSVDEVITFEKQRSTIVVGYVGSHGPANSLDALLDAMAALRNELISAVLVGGGPEKSRLERRIQAECLDRVRMIGPVPKAAIPSLLSKFDILYTGLAPHPVFRFGISPNKLIDYMMAAKPIVHASPVASDPVQSSGAGSSVPAGDALAIASAIAEIASLTPAERQSMGEKGRRYVEAEHDYASLARRFAEAVQ